MTLMRSTPASSARRAISPSREPSSGGPPSQVKSAMCKPTFICPLLTAGRKARLNQYFRRVSKPRGHRPDRTVTWGGATGTSGSPGCQFLVRRRQLPVHGGRWFHLDPAEEHRAGHGGQDHDDRGSQGGVVEAVGEGGP